MHIDEFHLIITFKSGKGDEKKKCERANEENERDVK